jgi:hypothetical protein
MTATIIRWHCLDPACDESGEGDKAAEKHSRDTSHGTTTHVREWGQS